MQIFINIKVIPINPIIFPLHSHIYYIIICIIFFCFYKINIYCKISISSTFLFNECTIFFYFRNGIHNKLFSSFLIHFGKCQIFICFIGILTSCQHNYYKNYCYAYFFHLHFSFMHKSPNVLSTMFSTMFSTMDCINDDWHIAKLMFFLPKILLPFLPLDALSRASSNKFKYVDNGYDYPNIFLFYILF